MQNGHNDSFEEHLPPAKVENNHDSRRLSSYLGELIVIDVSGRYVIAGLLERIDDEHLHLSSADVHDLRDSSTTRERYVLEIGQHGVRPNRKKVVVPRAQVMGLSLISDIIL